MPETDPTGVPAPDPGGARAEVLRQRYASWLESEQEDEEFEPVQRWWLDHMLAVVATQGRVTVDDLEQPPFTELDGVDGAILDLGPAVGNYMEALNRLLD